MKNFLVLFICFMIIKLIGGINPVANTKATSEKKQIEVKQANLQTFIVVGTLTQQEAVRLNLALISPLFEIVKVLLPNNEEYQVLTSLNSLTEHAKEKSDCYGVYQTTEVYSDS